MNSYQLEHIDWCQVYGIDRWAIIHNDPFHCCNLAIQHASEKGLGKTDKGNNRQIHHRQAMQTLHDIVSSDPVLAQIVADEVLAEFSLEYQYKLKTWRERIQRWLVNGRFAKKIMEGVDVLSDDDETTENCITYRRISPRDSSSNLRPSSNCRDAQCQDEVQWRRSRRQSMQSCGR